MTTAPPLSMLIWDGTAPWSGRVDSVQAGQHIADCGHLGNPVTDLLHFGVYRSWPNFDGDDLAVNFRNADGPLDARGGMLQGTSYLAVPY